MRAILDSEVVDEPLTMLRHHGQAPDERAGVGNISSACDDPHGPGLVLDQVAQPPGMEIVGAVRSRPPLWAPRGEGAPTSRGQLGDRVEISEARRAYGE